MAIAGLVTLIVAFVLMELAFQRFDSVWGEVAGLVLFLVWLASIVVTIVGVIGTVVRSVRQHRSG
jgi:heme exporter protein D